MLDHTKAEIKEIKQAQRELDEQYVKNHEDLTRQLEGIKTSNIKSLAEASTYFRPRKETLSEELESSLDQFSVKENIRKWLVTSTEVKSKDKEREEFYDQENKRYEEALKIKDREKDENFNKREDFQISKDQGEKINTMELGQDMWRQLQRISIPIFSGDKKSYHSWKAVFIMCVDEAHATAEYKLLQLRNYLRGEPLKVVKSLGHSAAAYEAAKSRLERKYGGMRRRIVLNLEEWDQFRPIRIGVVKDVEKLADLLDILVLNLQEAGRLEELGNSLLYIKAQKKMTEAMLTDFRRWIYEKSIPEGLEALRDWLFREAELQVIATETIKGLSVRNREPQQLLFGQTS